LETRSAPISGQDVAHHRLPGSDFLPAGVA